MRTATPAWSTTNLIATSEPARLPNSFNSSESTSPLSIRLTHFPATPSHRSCSPGILAASPSHRISFPLDLPPISADSSNSPNLTPPPFISHLDFSPCARYLLAVTTHENTDDSLSLFNSATGQIDQWSLVWTESLAKFGHAVPGGKRVVKARWLAEPKKWYPTPSTSTSKKALLATPTRSPPLLGTSFVLVLSCASLLFVHIPPSTPLVPLTVLLPLAASMSLHALPALSHSALNPLSPTSPQNDIDDLVANLVDGPPLNIATSLGLDITATPSLVDLGGIGVGAMRDQLQAAAVIGASEMERRKVGMAAIGSVRGDRQSIQQNESVFLLAWTSSPVVVASGQDQSAAGGSNDSSRQTVKPAATLDGDMDENGDFGMADFTELDQAFKPAVASGSPTTSRKESKGKSRAIETEQKVEMCELKVCSNAEGGPRLSVRALPPIFLCDPMDSNLAGETLTHLEWLEDVVLPEDGNAEAAADLRLLAVLSSRAPSGSPISSLLVSWAASNEPYQLSDAFNNLEGKKLEVTAGEKDWTMRRVLSKQVDSGNVTAISPRSGPGFATFFATVSKVSDDGVTSSTIAMFDSATLERLEEYGTIDLPPSQAFSNMQISPSKALVCAIDTSSGQPTLAATPLGRDEVLRKNLGLHIAIAILRQLDTSDLVGRVIGLKDEAATLDVLRVVRDTLQSMLATGRQLASTPLQLELLGLSQALFKASPGLYLRGTIAYDVVQLAALVRAFKIAENRERGSEAFRCDGDSVLPLVAHATFYVDFCRTLIADLLVNTLVKADGNTAEMSPRRILLLHPLPRSLLLSGVTYILALQQFFASFGETANTALRLSRNVLDDAIDFGGVSLREWSSVLIGLNEIVFASEVLEEALLTMTLSSELLSTGRILDALIAPTTLRTATLPTPPTPPLPLALDSIKKSRLPSLKADSILRRCTKCGEQTGSRAVSGGADGGKWSLFESGWKDRCACGGLWIKA